MGAHRDERRHDGLPVTTRAVLPDRREAPSRARPERAALLALQRGAGNRACVQLLRLGLQVQRVPAAPDFKKKPLSPADAGLQLRSARTDPTATSAHLAPWIGYIVDKVRPPAGPVKESYVSSFDTQKGGFSISRTLPDIPDLVVHAHYQRTGNSRTTGAINSSQVKWADKEEGDAPPGKSKLDQSAYGAILGSNHAAIALQAWEQNHNRHTERAKVADFAHKKWVKQGRPETLEPGDLDSLFS